MTECHVYHLLASPTEEEEDDEEEEEGQDNCSRIRSSAAAIITTTNNIGANGSFDIELDNNNNKEAKKSSDYCCSSSSSSGSSYKQQQQQQSHYIKYIPTILYGITTMLLFADQNLLAPNLSTIAKEFHFTDLERDYYLGGHIALGYFLVGAPAAYILGSIADICPSRSILFALTVICGESSCFTTYFTTTYSQLYWTRIITGISSGGALPILYSLLGDSFPPNDRPFVTALVGMGTGCGIALGQGIAGWIGPTYGWRTPFLLISLPAIFFATLIGFFVPEPNRGGMDPTNTTTTTTTTTTTNQQQQQQEEEEDEDIDVDEKDDDYVKPNKEQQQLQLLHQQYDYSDDTNIILPIEHEEDEYEESNFICTLELQNQQQLHQKQRQRQHKLQEEEEEIQDDRILSSTTHNCDSNFMVEITTPTTTSTTNIVSCCWNILTPTISLLRIPTVLLIVFQGAPGCLPWGIVNTYLNDYLSSDKGMSIQVATALLLLFGFGNFIGMSLGGWGGTVLYAKDVRYPHLLSGSAAILGILPLLFLINSSPSSSSTGDSNNSTSSVVLHQILSYVVAALVAGIGSGVTGPIVKATLTNVTLPTSRGTAFALLNTFDDFGRGLGPLFVAVLIQLFHGDRQRAFNVGIMGWLLCGLFNLAIFFVAKTDEQSMRNELSKVQ